VIHEGLGDRSASPTIGGMGRGLIAAAAAAAMVIAAGQLGLGVWAGSTIGGIAVLAAEATASIDESEDEAWEYFDEDESFEVNEDATLSPAPEAEVAEAWDLFRRVAGDAIIVEHVESFVVGEDEDSEFLAYVRPEVDDRWALVVNLAFDDPYDRAVTMIHEYAHLLSLNATQVDSDAEWNRCGETWIFEGCPHEDAVITRFQDRFWDMYGYDVPDGIAGAADVEEFWTGREDQFVSEYAATSVLEDFAESFTIWVLLEGDAPQEWGYDDLAAEKVEFFETDPATADERERILAGVSEDLYG